MSSSPIRFASFTDEPSSSVPNLPSSSSGTHHPQGSINHRSTNPGLLTSSQLPLSSSQHLLFSSQQLPPPPTYASSSNSQLPSSNSQHDILFSPSKSPRTPKSPGFLKAQGRTFMDRLHGITSTSSQLSSSNSQLMSTPTASSLEKDPTSSERFIWGTNINIQESLHLFDDFLKHFTLRHLRSWERANELNLEVHQLVEADLSLNDLPNHAFQPYYPTYLQRMKESHTFAMNLDTTHLLAYPPTQRLYYQLLNYPHEIISMMDVVATEWFQHTLVVTEQDKQLFSSIHLSVRPFHLNEQEKRLRDLNPSDIDRLISVKGLVLRSTPVIPDPKLGFFQCLVCQANVEMEIDRGKIEEPHRCPQCQALHTMQLKHQRCTFASKQVCKLQETPDMLPEGQTPHTLALNVYDDWVDSMKPGDRVVVTGIYRSMPIRVQPRKTTIRPVFRTFLDVVHVTAVDPNRIARNLHTPDLMAETCDVDSSIVTEEEEQHILAISQREDVYEYLARSLAPSIFELEDVKKGVLLQLFGGSSSSFSSSSSASKQRGDIHILLVGDPGVAKSQLLQYVHKITPRGVYTSGKGSSAVGLTASVVKDPDTRALVLESGALVLSDGGVCCIDEFDKMSDTTRAVLHEVMEQQTISIAKAGIITTLNARTSILASANPIKSKFDVHLTLVENIHLPPSLLSRFDLLFVLLDFPNEQYDRALAQHLTHLYMGPSKASMALTDVCPPSLLTKYIAYARNQCRPTLDDASANLLVKHYVEMRSLGRTVASTSGKKTVTATIRQLESMLRLSEALAKLRLKSTVSIQDVNEACRLIKEAMKQGATDPRTGKLDLDLLTIDPKVLRARETEVEES